MQPRKAFIGLLQGMTVSAALLVIGCATTASLHPDSADGALGTPRYYSAPKHRVFEVAQAVALELGLRIVETAPDHSYFIAKRGLTGLDFGTLIGVYFGTQIDNVSLVVIRTEPVAAANIVSKDFSLALHNAIDSKLHIPKPDKPSTS